MEINSKDISYSTENEYNINRLNKLLNSMNIDFEISYQGNVYVITVKKKLIVDILDENLFEIELNDNLKRALIRGSYMGSGSINNPNKTYHLEMVLKNKNNAIYLKSILQSFGINCKELNRKNAYSLYIKEGEEISKFLALIGASIAVIRFEEIRVLKDIRNNVNRKVNCETANLNKTISASVREIEDIKLIKKKNVKLSENLEEIAELRLENPDANLVELGNMLKNPIGKSGTNHRLKKIHEIAEELRKNI